MGAETRISQPGTGAYPSRVDLPRNGRHQPMVDINMLTPDNLLGRFHLLHRFFGREGIKLVREIKNGKGLLDPSIQGLRAAADKHFFNEVAATFGNSHNMSASESQEFYITSLTAANKAIEQFNHALPDNDEIKGMNEVTIFDPSPSSILYYLNAPDVKPRLRFEIERQIALGYIAGAIEARTRNSGLQQELAIMQQVFNDSLYVGDSGAVDEITTYAWHDNQTNTVIELAGRERPRDTSREGMHLKKHFSRMRRVNRVGNVSADFDIKAIESSILKAVFKAMTDREQGNGGIVDIDVAVRDTIRAKMFVEGTDNIADPRIKRLIGKFTSRLRNAEKVGYIQPIKSIVRKDEKHDDPKKPRFKRLMITFANLPIPFEIIFYDQKTALNEKFHVGTMQPSGEFDGYAHPLYELQRLGRILQAIYPEGVFQNDNGEPYITLQDIVGQQEPTAMDLIRARRN